MLPAAVFTIAKVREESKCLAMDEWTDRVWCTHTVEQCSAVTKSGVQTVVPCRDPGVALKSRAPARSMGTTCSNTAR